jgi:hypothetical protein
VKDGEFIIKSSRYPFCATGVADSDSSIRSGMTLVPFNQELNRLLLVAKNGSANSYRVTWGAESKTYSAAQLAQGINLANDFAVNPFSEAFKKVDAAVIAKQNYETKQIKQIFHELVNGRFSAPDNRCQPADTVKDEELKRLFKHCQDGKFDRDALASDTYQTRQPLDDAIKAAFVPVTHTIAITPE